MQRDLLKQLSQWRHEPLRKPLILRGARQVGKSWLIDTFGKQFTSYVKINFDRDRQAARIFAADLRVEKIIADIALYKRQEIIPGSTLLFFDEVQECEQALKALRYFKEEMPELHVIAAGSLLDFALQSIGMSVGRVQFLYLHPLSFAEFLTAAGYDDLRTHILKQDISPIIHDQTLELLRTYMWLGGMPAVVDAWLQYKNAIICQNLQEEIIAAFVQDFYKYARSRQIPYVTKLFEAIPVQLGRKFKFVNVDRDLRAILLKDALFLLEKAGIAHICYHTSAQEVPLGAGINEKKFKVFFFDIGLAQKILGLNLEQWMMRPISIGNSGQIAEQLVAQELLAYSGIKSVAKLFYWHREAKSSNAEVDFVTTKNNAIIPIEVKASSAGAMRSMHMYLQSHKGSPYGLKISENNFGIHGPLHEVPLYGIESWERS